MISTSAVPHTAHGAPAGMYSPVPGKEYPSISGTTPSGTMLEQPSSQGIIPSMTSTLTSIVPQALSGVAQTASTLAQPVANVAWSMSSWTLSTFQSYWNQYPSLRAFLYAFAALTFIPVSIFAGYAAISSAIVGGIALVGVTVVEGGILGFGMLFLGPVLFFSFWGALIGTVLFTLTLYGLRLVGATMSTIQQAAGTHVGTGMVGSTVDAAKNVTVAAADIAAKTEAVLVGAQGMPEPMSMQT